MGRRRSASMRQTVCPACAIASARFVAVVLLPSPGTEDVTKTLFRPPATCANWRLVRSWRNASARWLWVPVCVSSGFFEASGSNVILPRSGASVICRSSASPRIRVSKVVRKRAMAMPSARPSKPPSARLIFVLGAEGCVGAAAGVIIDKRTGDDPPACGRSRLSTAWTRLPPTAWAIAAACAGDASEAVIVIRTVLGSELASMRPAKLSMESVSPSESMTGVRTTGVVTVFT